MHEATKPVICTLMHDNDRFEVEVIEYDRQLNLVRFELPKTGAVITAPVTRIYDSKVTDVSSDIRQWDAFSVSERWTVHGDDLVSVYSDDNQNTFTVYARGAFWVFKTADIAQRFYEVVAHATVLNAERGA